MTKEVVLQLIKKLRPLIEKKITKYMCVIHVGNRVPCSLYKISHGVNYLQCSEMFATRKSLINMILHEFVYAMNSILKNQIWWPQGEDLTRVMGGFKGLCGFLSVCGAIDCT
jgi:hypothetical protein